MEMAMHIDIKNFDLNLLRHFDALMASRSVTKAAAGMNLSQSAISHSLNRLCKLFDDPVLVKTRDGMTPTQRALELELPIRGILVDIQHNLYIPDPFNPMERERTFVIYSTEYFECVYLPILIARFEKQAPKINMQLGILTQKIPEKEIASGDVDFVIGVESMGETPKYLRSRPWVGDKLVCVVRAGNTDFSNRIGLKQYSEAGHIYHTMLGTPFSQLPLDRWLEQRNIKRQLAVTTTGYLSAAMIASETDYILTLPLRLAEKLVETMDLKILQPPDNFVGYQLNLIWHPLFEKDPAHSWLQNQLLNLVINEC
jgi:DNA-binding transcriptional LysR family regulator